MKWWTLEQFFSFERGVGSDHALRIAKTILDEAAVGNS